MEQNTPDIVDQVIGVLRAGARITDVSVVEASPEEIVKYLETVSPEIVHNARRDLVIAKQASLINSLNAATTEVDVNEEEANPEDE